MGAPISIQLVTDQNYLKTLLKLLDQAQYKIDILAFSFAIGSASGAISKWGAPFQIAEKLAEVKKKLKSKIQIRLYIEGERETSSRNQVTANYLKKHGVRIKYGATHAKGFAIDDHIVFFGSTNLTQQSIAKNNEANFLIDDEAVAAEFEKYFKHLWKGGRHGGIHLNPPLLADGDFKDKLIEIINNAKKSVEFSIYFFNHAEIESALIKAHKRGVKVSGFVHNHGAFAMSYVRKSIATVRRMYATGIKKVYLGPINLFSHAKFLIADGKQVIMGTGNWLIEDVKIHPQLYIALEDRSLAKKMSAYLKTKMTGKPFSA
jgi:phosphatidylserine/phosphatidylglycerophosphate/cardiolipin synthase-like enzyme